MLEKSPAVYRSTSHTCQCWDLASVDTVCFLAAAQFRCLYLYFMSKRSCPQYPSHNVQYLNPPKSPIVKKIDPRFRSRVRRPLLLSCSVFFCSPPNGTIFYIACIYFTASSTTENRAPSTYPRRNAPPIMVWQADADMFATCTGVPDKAKAPHAYRWYIHIAAIKGVRRYGIKSVALDGACHALCFVLLLRVRHRTVSF